MAGLRRAHAHRPRWGAPQSPEAVSERLLRGGPELLWLLAAQLPRADEICAGGGKGASTPVQRRALCGGETSTEDSGTTSAGTALVPPSPAAAATERGSDSRRQRGGTFCRCRAGEARRNHSPRRWPLPLFTPLFPLHRWFRPPSLAPGRKCWALRGGPAPLRNGGSGPGPTRRRPFP